MALAQAHAVHVLLDSNASNSLTVCAQCWYLIRQILHPHSIAQHAILAVLALGSEQDLCSVVYCRFAVKAAGGAEAGCA